MSHAQLLADGIPFEAPEHLTLVLERLRYLQRVHQKRIQNVELERKIIQGDIWLDPPNEDERRVTMPIGHNIVNLGASLLLPKPPNITILPTSQSPSAQFEADAVQRWTYAALDNLRFAEVSQAWAKETMFGVGALHMTPDKYAMEDEMPILLDVPDANSILYHVGPRRSPDYVLLKHTMAVRDIKRMFDTDVQGKDTDEYTVWCYYCEERILRADRAEKMVVYGVLFKDQWAYPLADITSFMPEIPLFMAFNSDGYQWRGLEEMRAYGILTPSQSLLLYASDYMTELANGNIRNINPPIDVMQDPNSEPIPLDLRPGGINRLNPGEAIRASLAGQPNVLALNFYQQIMSGIGDATFPQVFSTKPQDITGVSGSTFSESQQPLMVKNNSRQTGLEGAMQQFITCMLRHMARVIDPTNGFELYGIDPRDKRQIQQMMHPAMLLQNTRVRVQLSQQTPRNVMQWVTLIQQLAQNGIVPRNLATEMVAQWMELPVTDMTSISADIAADDAYKAQLDLMKQQAMQGLPYVRQQQNQMGQNPNLMRNGEKPYRLGTEGTDPLATVDVHQPTSYEQQQPQLLGAR